MPTFRLMSSRNFCSHRTDAFAPSPAIRRSGGMIIPSMDTAKAYAIVFHLIQLPHVFTLGMYCLMRERMSMLQLQSEGEELAHEDERE